MNIIICGFFPVFVATCILSQISVSVYKIYELVVGIGYDNTSNKVEFQFDRVKVKAAVTIFRKNFVITLAPLFLDQF